MTKLSSRIFIVLILICGSTPGKVRTSASREFDEQAMSGYTENANFAYMDLQLQPPSIWDMLKWWLQDLLIEFLSDPVSSRLALYLFIAIVLGIAIFYVVKIRYGRILARTGGTHSGTAMPISSDLDSVDYQPLIEQSLANKDFKSAIRYLYLNALDLMAHKEVISLQEWKTPYDYLAEMPKEIAAPYAQLSTQFEYSWYGDFEVGRKDFDKSRNLKEKIEEGL